MLPRVLSWQTGMKMLWRRQEPIVQSTSGSGPSGCEIGNEPTLLLTPIVLSIAGVTVPAGIYSIYTVPGPTEWEIIVNRSYSQWGMESFYTEEVQAQEVGRGRVPSESTDSHIETFTIRAEDSPTGTLHVILEWERTRVPVPVALPNSQ